MSEFVDLEILFKQKYAKIPGSFSKQSRLDGMKYFLSKGMPSKKDEAWKYTSLKKLSERELIPSAKKKLDLPSLSNSQFHQIFVVDGEIYLKASDRKALKGKVTISRRDLTVTQALKHARRMTGKLRQDSLEALNSAFSQGICLFVHENAELKKPLQIVFSSRYPRLQAFISEGAKLNLIEAYFGDETKQFTDAVSEISIAKSAHLNYLRIQSENKNTIHFGCTRIFLHQQSHLESLVYATGAEISRHNLDIHCLGEKAEAIVNGLTLGGGDQHFDNSTRIDHAVGHCNTNQLYKSLLSGKSKAVFRGQVEIRPGAQKASSEQLNKNLLLSKDAEADSVPQLNIFADDVKATHGSTVGQMSEEEIFYLLSRAISREKAIELVSLGFVKDLEDRISNPKIRQWLAVHLERSYQELQS